MNNQPRLSIWDRSPIVRAVRGLLTWRDIRRELIILAWTATIIALLYGVENWCARHAWNQYRRQLEARGEQLDLKAFIPNPVPDGQNFAATPLVQSWFTERTNYTARWNDSYSRVEMRISTSKTKDDLGNRHFLDLVAWQLGLDAFRSGGLKPGRKFESDKLDFESRARAAPSVLEDLKSYEVVFAELRSASQRPYARYPVVYDLEDPWGILIPHLGNLRQVCRRLHLKACAELAAGQSENALEDVKLMLYLTGSVKGEPTLISYLVRIACLQLATQPIWEGLAEHAWSGAQLQQIQSHLQQYDFVADLKRPLDTERAAGFLTVDLIQKKGLGYLVALENSGGEQVPPDRRRTMANVISFFIPHGWYYQEKLSYCRLFQVELEGTYDTAHRRVSPNRIASNTRELERAIQLRSPVGVFRTVFIDHHVIAAMLLRPLGRVPLRAAMAQTAADQTVLACALERYRLANGQFPERLDALVPQFISQLPNDVITGAPYKYRHTASGQFVLYSVGWNEKDDGGVPGKTLFDEKQGDWVWTYPEK
jgi:hypothetical protein